MTTPAKPLSVTIREYLILGLLTTAPLAVTFWVIASAVQILDDLMYHMIPGLRALPLYIGFGLPGIGILATFIVLLGAGSLAKTVAGQMFGNLSDSLVGHVPFVRGLYNMTKQISSVFFSSSPTSAFKHVVYVPFPSAASRALAFIASPVDEDHSLVFVPTAPNPTGGYVLKFHNSQLEATPLTIDAALQIILSCGAVGAGKRTHEPVKI